MNNRPRIGRDVLMLLIGAAIAAIFAVMVAYPELLANSKENVARIAANEDKIALLWEAHRLEHEPAIPGGGTAP